jgi:hypothetical protein
MKPRSRPFLLLLFGSYLLTAASCSDDSLQPDNHEAILPVVTTSSTQIPTDRPVKYPTSSPVPTADPLSPYEGDCVFCFFDDSNPREPVWDSAAGGFTYHEDDPREIIIIDETFTVPSGQITTFENQIVLIRPTQRKDIDVYGRLIIQDSLLIWQQTEYQQTRLIIKNGAELIIKDSYSFWGNQYWVNWDFEDGSKISFDHFIGDPWCSLEGSVEYVAKNLSTVKLTIGNFTHDTNIQVSDAHHLWLELFPSEGTHTVSLPEKGIWGDWKIDDLWPGTVVDVKNSYIYERDISLSNNTHITVEDTPSGFSLGWAISKYEPGFVECQLYGLGEPGNAAGVFYENRTWDLPCNNSSLTVKNSLLQRSWPVTWGWINLKIYDSFLVDVRNYGGPATVEIYNSSLDIIAAYQGGLIYIENTPVREAVEVKDQGSVIYGHLVSGNFQVLESDGGEYQIVEKPGPPWK